MIEKLIKQVKELEKYKEIIANIDTKFFFYFAEKIINSYNKEKARADKLEKDYSKLLTKVDDLESRLNND